MDHLVGLDRIAVGVLHQQIGLEDKHAELERYFTLSLDLLCIADTDGHFIRLNTAWQDILGYPVEELVGRSFLDFIHFR